MTRHNRFAEVKLSGQTVGFIAEENGQTSFAYTSAWLNQPGAEPVSLTLPLRPEPYVYEDLHPFFENLLPEGWLLDVVSKKCKVSKDDAFGVLLATCGECVGAVEIFPANDSSNGSSNSSPARFAIDDEASE